jgi:hypothetical protein
MNATSLTGLPRLTSCLNNKFKKSCEELLEATQDQLDAAATWPARH